MGSLSYEPSAARVSVCRIYCRMCRHARTAAVGSVNTDGMSDEHKHPPPPPPTLVSAFIRSIHNSARNPYGCIVYACQLAERGLDPTPFVKPHERADFAAKLLRSVNRVILDPLADETHKLHGEQRKVFHISWPMPYTGSPAGGRHVATYHGLWTVHCRLRVDGCRLRFDACTACMDHGGLGPEFDKNATEKLAQDLERTMPYSVMHECGHVMEIILHGENRAVDSYGFLPRSVAAGFAENTINQTPMHEAIYEYMMPYLEQIKEARPQVPLVFRQWKLVWTATIRAVHIDRVLEHEKRGFAAQVAFAIIPSDEAMHGLPQSLKTALEWNERWEYIVEWADPDIAPTHIAAELFNQQVQVYSKKTALPENGDGYLGTITLYQALQHIVRKADLPGERPFSKFIEEKMDEEDAEEVRARNARLKAKAHKARQEQRQEDAMYRSDSFVAMDLDDADATEQEDDDE
jgi:hypothetical protein